METLVVSIFIAVFIGWFLWPLFDFRKQKPNPDFYTEDIDDKLCKLSVLIDSHATHSIPSGTFVVQNNSLYRTSKPIHSGEHIESDLLTPINIVSEYQKILNKTMSCNNNTTVHMSDYVKPKPHTCPNCGAPIHGSTCEYCNTEFY